MITRLLKYLRQRADFFFKHGHRGEEHDEVYTLIEHLQLSEIVDANETKRRKWVSVNMWLYPGQVLLVIDDEQLAKDEH